MSKLPRVVDFLTSAEVRVDACVLRANGQPLADDEARRVLLGQVRRNEGAAVELELELLAYRQVEGEHNRNFIRFKPSILSGFARSFKNVPLLRDHNQYSLDARGGTVVDVKSEKLESGGVEFRMTALVTAQWAVESVLAGNLDRFSIGWRHGGYSTILCSACKAPMMQCAHYPGDTVGEGEDAKRVEFIFTVAEGIEVSAVTVPAVSGTGVEEIRAALSAAPRAARTQENHMLREIAEALGLSPEASEETVLAALKARDEQSKRVLAENSSLKGELEGERKDKRAAQVSALFEEYKDRLPKERNAAGDKVASGLETHLRKLAEADVEAARNILATLPSAPSPVREPVSLAPAAPSSPSSPADPRMPLAPAAPVAATNPVLASQLKQLGLSDEDYSKFNPVDGSAVPVQNRWGVSQ